MQLLTTALLLDRIPYGTIGNPNMSPACAALDDGTFLLASSIRSSASGERVQVWHLGADGTVLGTYSYAGSDVGKDPALVATKNAHALLVVTEGTTSTLITLDASGPTPVEASVQLSTWEQDFTNTLIPSWGFYLPDTDQVVLGGYNGVGLYTAGAHTDHYQPTTYSWEVNGWWRNPSDPTKFAVLGRSNGVRSGIEFTVGPDSLTFVTKPEWTAVERYWLFGAGDPYSATPVNYEANPLTPRPDGWQLLDPNGTQLAVIAPNDNGSYQNVSGPTYPVAPGIQAAVYEYDLYYGDQNTEKWSPAIALIDSTVSPPTRDELVLDWWEGAISVNYGSWTADVHNGVMILAGTNVNRPTTSPQEFSLGFWLIQVGTSVAPEAAAFSTGNTSTASGRLQLRQAIAAPIESVLNETPGKIGIVIPDPTPETLFSVYPGENQPMRLPSTGRASNYGISLDPGLVQTLNGFPRQPALSVVADTLCSTSGEFLTTGRDLPEAVDMGTQVRFLPSEMNGTSLGAHTGSLYPWSLQASGPVEKLTASYRRVKEIFSFSAVSLDPGGVLAGDFGYGDTTAMTVSGVFLLRTPLGYQLLSGGDDDFALTATPYWTGRNAEVTRVSQLSIAAAAVTPLFITAVFAPPLVTYYISTGPGATNSFTVRSATASVIPATVKVGGPIANAEMLELNIDLYARTSAQVEQLNAQYGSIYGYAMTWAS